MLMFMKLAVGQGESHDLFFASFSELLVVERILCSFLDYACFLKQTPRKLRSVPRNMLTLR